MNYKKQNVIIVLIFSVVTIVVSLMAEKSQKNVSATSISFENWEVQSIDTMKESRDRVREYPSDPNHIKKIDKLVSLVAETNATHISIATPYDPEFVPILRDWVRASRKYNLKVWFRSNLSGWENWFDYPSINKDERLEQLGDFITNNQDLFEDGDIFSSCTECENGQIGDPRETGDIEGFRSFILNEFDFVSSKFNDIGKNVRSNYYPMNGDVASLVMDEETTNRLGDIIVVDHYVDSPEKLYEDSINYIKSSKGKLVLGEWGAPITQINSEMDEEAQRVWIESALEKLSKVEGLVGVNYWTLSGGSSSILNTDFEPKSAYNEIKNSFSGKTVKISVKDQNNIPLSDVEITIDRKKGQTNVNGEVILNTSKYSKKLDLYKKGFSKLSVNIPDNNTIEVTLVSEPISFLSSIWIEIKRFLNL